MTKLDLLEANKIYDSIIQTNKDLGKNLLDAETYSFAKKFIKERDVSEEIKKYTMFLIDERVHEEFHRITIQLNKEFEDVIKEIKS
ncbi:hypothetical protein [Agathobacter rectalis]|uniref:Uncharacterized protein n=1 Tax=Agathobacter rectalis TaxID=39491 RepID=A0A3E4YL75_9FIRM|nr:hypothetical protein [Agathobacter rectalis]RGM75343.1 hypothetical protein DXB99_02060 [Agathobacter rectalis]